MNSAGTLPPGVVRAVPNMIHSQAAMADENWLTALLKVPARFGRKLIDIA
jgi:hypothetical protein